MKRAKDDLLKIRLLISKSENLFNGAFTFLPTLARILCADFYSLALMRGPFEIYGLSRVSFELLDSLMCFRIRFLSYFHSVLTSRAVLEIFPYFLHFSPHLRQEIFHYLSTSYPTLCRMGRR